jgi:two-component system response regulator NreC
MASALKRREPRRVAVAVLDANPILGDAMCRHFSATEQFGHDEVVSLTWDQSDRVVQIQPAILVLDPTQAPDGLDQLVAELRANLPAMQLVAYAADSTEDLARACLNLGFRAFIPKSADASQLTAAVRTVANGGMYVDRAFAEALRSPSDAPVSEDPNQLSTREEAVLQRIAMGHSHKQIGAELGLSHKTVDTYRARGMRKLGVIDRGTLIRLALKHGWLG